MYQQLDDVLQNLALLHLRQMVSFQVDWDTWTEEIERTYTNISDITTPPLLFTYFNIFGSNLLFTSGARGCCCPSTSDFPNLTPLNCITWLSKFTFFFFKKKKTKQELQKNLLFFSPSFWTITLLVILGGKFRCSDWSSHQPNKKPG